jgi:hypothetical protein
MVRLQGERLTPTLLVAAQVVRALLARYLVNWEVFRKDCEEAKEFSLDVGVVAFGRAA